MSWGPALDWVLPAWASSTMELYQANSNWHISVQSTGCNWFLPTFSLILFLGTDCYCLGAAMKNNDTSETGEANVKIFVTRRYALSKEKWPNPFLLSYQGSHFWDCQISRLFQCSPGVFSNNFLDIHFFLLFNVTFNMEGSVCV